MAPTKKTRNNRLADTLREQAIVEQESPPTPVADILSSPVSDERRTTVYLSEDLRRKLKMKAAEHGTTISDITARALQNYLATGV
jgi:ribbon-helix-helix protein, copG family